MRNYLLPVMVVLSLSSAIAEEGLAESHRFRIQDYIPEYFRDFKWKVDGSGSISGSDKDYFRDDYPADMPIPEYDLQNKTDWSLTFGNDVQYTFRTPDKFLNLGLVLDATTDGVSESRRILQDIPYPENVDLDIKVRSYNFVARPEAEGGYYFVGDFFICSRLSAFLDYDRTPVNNRSEALERTILTDSLLTVSTRTVSRDELRLIREYQVSWERSIGWGRVYEGQYASTAMYMIEELRSKNALLREPTKDEMLTLCDIVYRNRLKHAVDPRLRRIEIFEEIITFLTEHSIIRDTGAFGYLAIEDVWDYFPRRSRKFGCQIITGHVFDYSYNSSELTANYASEYLTTRYHMDSPDVVDTLSAGNSASHRWCRHRWKTFLYNLHGSLAVYMPLSRRWQLDMALTSQYTLDARCDDEYYGVCSRCSNCNYCLGARDEFIMGLVTDAEYIFDSRTSLMLGSFFSYRNVNGYYWKVDFSAALEYRLSIPTTLVVSGGISQYRAEPDYSWELDHASYSFSVSLSHYLY